MTKRIILGLAILAMVLTPMRAQDQGWGNRGPGNGNRGGGGIRFDGGMEAMIAILPLEDLSDTEVAGLFHMREEEKLARDIYTTLYAEWITVL